MSCKPTQPGEPERASFPLLSARVLFAVGFFFFFDIHSKLGLQKQASSLIHYSQLKEISDVQRGPPTPPAPFRADLTKYGLKLSSLIHSEWRRIMEQHFRDDHHKLQAAYLKGPYFQTVQITILARAHHMPVRSSPGRAWAGFVWHVGVCACVCEGGLLAVCVLEPQLAALLSTITPGILIHEKLTLTGLFCCCYMKTLFSTSNLDTGKSP